MTTEHQIEGTLRSLADAGGPPDEDLAWQAIVARIETDARQRRRHRVVAGGLVTAAAAAGLVVAVALGTADEAPEPIDIGPAGPGETTAPTTGAEPPPAPTTDATLPRDPVVMLSEDMSKLHVVDGETGEIVATPLDDAEPGTSVLSSAEITEAGTIYGTRYGAVMTMEWNESNELRPVPIAAPSVASGWGPLAVSPDGRTLAVSKLDVDTGSLTLLDLPSGDVRVLEWPAGDDRGFYTQPQELSFSPDGQRLAFVNVHDTDGTDGFDAYVIDVDAASLAAAEQVNGLPDQTWDATFTPDGGLLVEQGLGTGETQLRYVEGGPDVGIPQVSDVRGIFATAHGIYARTETTTFRYDPATDAWVDAGFWGYE